MNWTIDLGQILVLVGMLASITAFIYAIRQHVAVLVERMKAFEGSIGTIEKTFVRVDTELGKVSEALLQLARQDERLKAFDTRFAGLDTRIAEIVAAAAAVELRAEARNIAKNAPTRKK